MAFASEAAVVNAGSGSLPADRPGSIAAETADGKK